MNTKTAQKSCMTLNIDNYKAFIEQVREDPKAGQVQFSAKTEWRDGTITRTVARDREILADEPEALGGQDSAADPVELLLASLTSCVSIGLVTHAANQGIDFDDFEIEITGALDLRGYLGLDEDTRPGYTSIDYTVRVKSDADRDTLENLLSNAEQHSPMFDNILNGVPLNSTLEVI